jgi:hypothetical protein
VTARRLVFAAGAVLAGALGSACAPPLLHPLRASNGPYAEGAISYGVHAGQHGSCDNFEGCVDSEGTGGGHLNFLQFGGGYSHVFREYFGVMGGLHFPGWEDFKHGGLIGTLGLTSFFTVQNDYFSTGVGPEIGGGGWAVTAGGEAQPWGKKVWRPRVGIYGRRFWPFSPSEKPDPSDDDIWRDPRVKTWEVGGRLRVGFIVLGYEYYMQDDGVMYWTIYETASYAQGHHTFTIGMSVDMDTVRVLEKRRRY